MLRVTKSCSRSDVPVVSSLQDAARKPICAARPLIVSLARPVLKVLKKLPSISVPASPCGAAYCTLPSAGSKMSCCCCCCCGGGGASAPAAASAAVSLDGGSTAARGAARRATARRAEVEATACTREEEEVVDIIIAMDGGGGGRAGR